MQNDENTEEVQLETQDEQVVEETTESEPQSEEAKEEGVKLSPAEYRHYLKWKNGDKPSPKKVVQPQTSSPSNVEETVLLANGMPEDLLNELKAVARARNLNSLIKAQNDPIFVAVKEKYEKEQKQLDASLPASRGAGATKVQKSFNTPGLSRDEHRKLVLENQ